jgi:hypothetical protein
VPLLRLPGCAFTAPGEPQPSRWLAELNALSTANDLGDPRIMNLRADEGQVDGELCQLANPNYRARYGGCLAQAGIMGGIIQQTRPTEGLIVSLIGVCMKVGAASFPIFFAIALLFPPQLARRSATQGFDGRDQSLH